VLYVWILLEVTAEETLKCLAVTSLVTKTLENAVKTGVFKPFSTKIEQKHKNLYSRFFLIKNSKISL